MHLEYTVIEGDFVNAGSASSSIKKTLKQLNVNPSIIKRVVVALYGAFPILTGLCRKETQRHLPKLETWDSEPEWVCLTSREMLTN